MRFTDTVDTPPSFVLKYYLYTAIKSARFSVAVWVVYLTSEGISFSQIGFLDGIYSVAIIAFEIPTGYIGDRLGRRNSIVVSLLLSAAGSIGFALTGSFLTFASLYIGLAVGQTFRSGTASAWLYDVLDERLDGDQFAHVRGRGKAFGYVVGGAAAVVGGYLGELSLAYPWILEGVVMLFAVPVVLSLPETDTTGDQTDFRLPDAIPVIRDHLPTRPLRSFVLYTGVVSGVLGTINFFVQPVSLDAGFTPGTLGWLFAGFTIVSAAVSYNTGRIKERFGVAQWFRVAPMVLGVGFGLLYWLPAAVVPLFFLHKIVRGVGGSLRGQFVNDRTGSFGRATVLSAISMVTALLVLPFEVGGGMLADEIGAVPTMAVLGGVLVVVLLIITVVEDPFTASGSDPPEAAVSDD